MPGLYCVYKEFINKAVYLEQLFALFYCEIESPKDIYFGLLPTRDNRGLISPEGKWSGWSFS